MSSEASAENEKNDKNEAITGKLAKTREKFMKNGSTILHKSCCRTRVFKKVIKENLLKYMILVKVW